MTYDPTIIDLLANQVLNCVCVALDETATVVDGQPGCPCRACVVPGTVAWDACCDDCENTAQHGQLSVQVVRIFRSSNFPLVDQSVDCRAATMAVELLVSLLRCTPVMDDNGKAPSCEAIAASASVVHTDMFTMMQAVLCCVPDDPLRTKRRRLVINDHRTVAPSGGCAGSELRFTVDLNDPCGCQPVEES